MGQNKKAPDKGKAKPLGKMKKNVAKSAPNTVLTAGPSANMCKANYEIKLSIQLLLIQEITEELQAIEEESSREEQDSDATQESDLEQEDSDNTLTESEKVNNDYVKGKKQLFVLVIQI